ncbi:MAG TPA: peptidase domain-containing ABC transporter [Longimicrobium sp.]|nr:peptidase domain-containing ABC transporter [Longimicrobium sp.]
MPPARSVDTPPVRDAFQQFFRLLRLVRPYWGALLKGIAISFAIGMIGMAPPYLSKLLVDRVYVSHDATLMKVLVAGIFAVEIAKAIMGFIRNYFTVSTVFRLSSATTLLFFNHLQHLRVRFFDEHRVGEVSSRFQDVRASLTASSRIFESLLLNGTYMVLVPPFLLLLHWKLALVALATVPLSVGVMALSAPSVRRYHKRTAEAFAGLSAYQVEMLTQIRTLKAMALEHHVFRRADGLTREALDHQVRGLRYSLLFTLLNVLLKSLGTAVLIFYAWKLVLAGEMSLGDYVAFMMYKEFLSSPLSTMINNFAEFQQSSVNMGRMFEYLDTAPEQPPASAYATPPPIRHVVRGDIRIRDVSFDYNPERRIIREVDMEFPRGSITAVVGPSGAGKSTLFRLITRMEEASGGQILIDDVPIRQLSLADLRRQVTVVWQEVGMVRGTVWENLTLGAEHATPAAVHDAVRLCGLESVLEGMKLGYDTSIAEAGSTLSGGQRQRISLARALVRDTPVLLLDEATSNLDMKSEMEILPGLFARYEGRTVVFVTHRISTAALADNIYVVEDGRVVGAGSHDELLLTCDAYQRLQGSARPEAAGRLRAVPT